MPGIKATASTYQQVNDPPYEQVLVYPKVPTLEFQILCPELLCTLSPQSYLVANHGVYQVIGKNFVAEKGALATMEYEVWGRENTAHDLDIMGTSYRRYR